MYNPTRYGWQTHPIPLSMLILSVLVLFTVFIFNAPYTGFYFNPSSGEIFEVDEVNGSVIQVGDVLIKVGDVLFSEYDTDPTQPLFTNEMKKGDIIPITVIRNDVEQTILWQMPGFQIHEFRGRLFNIWWLAYIFWIFGACIEAFIRPREIRWWLLLFSIHLTGFWIILGSFSSWHLWAGSILFHAVTWLLLPIYLHLNWIFPKPLFTIPKKLAISIYAIAGLLFFAELTQTLPPSAYALAFIVALGGSTMLQIVHFVWKPEQRKQLKLLLLATLFATIPLITLGITSMFGEIPSSSPAVLLFFLFIPIIYIYLIVRDKLGGLEVRANNFISAFAFIIIIGTLLIILIRITALLPVEFSAFLNFVIPILSVIASLRYFPNLKKYIEKNILGIKMDNQTLQQEYIERIVTCTSLNSLLQLLEEETFPSLFIRQYAFVQNTNGNLKALLSKNVSANVVPDETAINNLLERSGKFIPDVLSDDWMRLILPLQIGDSTLGFFLLGQRDPDDVYHQIEIPIFQTIANQTAVALSNIVHSNQLKQMYQLGTERYELERSRFARDLHDVVLNELGEFRRNLFDLSPTLEASYQKITDGLHEIVSDLRPQMLLYGLAAAIQSFAENLMQKTNNTLKVNVTLQTAEERLPENIELHLFRIVEQASNNSLLHGKASAINISGVLSPEKVDLFVKDDGIGFEIEEKWELGTILASHHFGLIGMIERAHIIDATLNIQSQPNRGTKIQILWSAKIY